MEFCYSGGYYTLKSGGFMKEYVLKIKYNPVTEEIVSVKEYIEGATAKLCVDDKEMELDDELSGYIVDDIIGIT
jgi:hypothetical protein